MLVQRLTKRLANLLSGLAARLHAVFARLSPGERWPGGGTSPRDDDLSTQQSGSWLDDAHRLRPRRAALATADQSRGKHAAANEPRPAANEPRPAPHAGTPTHPVVPAAPPQEPRPQEPRPARPWVFPAHPTSSPVPQPQPQPQPAASDAPGGDEVQARRRLISLKYLVRIGLYNEGFAPNAVPEQYQRSLGIDDEE